MKHHPFTEIWPLMSGQSYDDLKADIKAHGLLTPVLTYQDQVLDGRNRERACEETGTPVRYEPAPVTSDDEALRLVVSLNMHRRHLSPTELAFAAERIATLRPSLHADSFEMALDAAAKMVGSNRAAVNRARAIRRHGTQADVDDVLAGKASLTAKSTHLLAKTRRKKREAAQSRKTGGDQILHIIKSPELDQSPSRGLTREQIDPEFTGTPYEWTDKYGHVQVMTAEEYQTMRFRSLAANWRSMVKYWRKLPHDARKIDPNWLRSPRPQDVDWLAEALADLEASITEARDLLAVAQAALQKKTAA